MSFEIDEHFRPLYISSREEASEICLVWMLKGRVSSKTFGVW
jgi:hypothetical protein